MADFEIEEYMDQPKTFTVEETMDDVPTSEFEIETTEEDKLTFDNLRTNKDHVAKIRRVYNEAKSDKEAIDQWIDDGVYRDQNTYSAIKQFVELGYADDEESADLAYAFQSWEEMPTIFQKGGRGFWEGLGHNFVAGATDPLSYAGAGLGGILAKKIGIKAAQKIAAATTSKTITGAAGTTTAELVGKEAVNLARKAALKQRGAVVGGAMAGDAAAGGIITGMTEATAVEHDLQDEINYGNVALGAAAAAVGSVVPGLLVNSGFKAVRKYRAHRTVAEVPKNNSGVPLKGEELVEHNKLVDEYGQTAVSFRGEDWLRPIRPTIERMKTADWWFKGGMFSGNIRQAVFDLGIPVRTGPAVTAFVDPGKIGPDGKVSSEAAYFHNASNMAVRATLTAKGRTEVILDNGMASLKKNNEGDLDWGSIEYLPGRRGLTQMLDDLGEDWIPFMLGFTAKRERLLRDTRMVGGHHIDTHKPVLDADGNVTNPPKMMVTSPASDKAVDAMIREFDSNPRFIKIADEFEQLGRDLLQFKVDTGVMSPVVMKRITDLADPETQRLWYLPFFRIEGGTKGKKLQIKGAGETAGHRIKGKATKEELLPINNPLQNMAMNVQNTIQMGVNNVAFRTTIDTLEARGFKDVYFSKLSGTEETVVTARTVAMDNVKSQLRKAGASDDVISQLTDEVGEDSLIFWARQRRSQSSMGKELDDGLQAVMRDGSIEWYRVNETSEVGTQLFRMFDAIGRTSPFNEEGWAYGALRNWQGAKRLFSSSVTSVPTFVLTNGTRDTVQAAAMNTTGGMKNADGTYNITPFIPLANIVSGVKAQFDEKLYKEFLLSGAGHQSQRKAEGLSSGDMRGFKSNIPEQDMNWRQKTMSKSQVLQLGVKGKDAYLRALSAGENAVRMLEFKNAREMGMSIEQAGLRAADISTPFSLRGSSQFVQAWTALTPFLNPGLQGVYHVARRFHQNPVRVTLAVSAMTAGTLKLHDHNKNDPYYLNLADDIRDMNWIVLIDEDGYPTMATGKPAVDHWMARKPFDLGTVFASFPERIVEAVDKHGVKSLKAVDQVLYHAFRLSTTYMSLDMTPYGVGTAMDWAMNENWKGGPIVPKSLEGGEPGRNSREDTQLLYKRIGELTTFHPLFVEHVMNDLWGSSYKLLMSTADRAMRGLLPDAPNLPTMDLNRYPIIRAVAGDPLGRSQAETDFYNLMKNTAPYREQDQINQMKGDRDDLERMLTTIPFVKKAIAASKETQRIIKQLSQANRNRDKVLRMSDDEISADQRAVKIKKIRAKTRKYMTKFMERMHKHPELEMYIRQDNMYNIISRAFQARLGVGVKQPKKEDK